MTRRSNMTRRQRAAMRARGKTGLLLLAEDEEEEDVDPARPGPAPRGRPKTDIPPGTPVRRLPPGAAGGVLPFDWPNAGRRVSNKSLKRDMEDLVRVAEQHGCRVKPGKHWKLLCPSGEIVISSKTPSDQRALLNFRAQLRRAGVPVQNPHQVDPVRQLADRLASSPLRRENLRRRSDKIRELEQRLRKLEDHHASIEDILDRQKPSPNEAKELRKDLFRLETEIEDIEQHIAQLEATIELEGDIIGERPPKPTWGIVRTRNRR